MVEADQEARGYEYGVCELDDGEVAKIGSVNEVGDDAEGAETEGELVDKPEEDMQCYYEVYHT